MPDQLQNDELVMGLVELALARPPERRQAYLRTACSDDPHLFQQVWQYVQWEERMNGFLLEPLHPPIADEHPFEAGTVLLNRFRIVRKVGEGGMAVVYEAFDEKLGHRIAIKCAKIGFHKRLPPEVRHAHEIGHPSVCKVFEIHQVSTSQGEIDFLTMEFLEGPTLAGRLLDGPLPNDEARIIAQQLSAGLAEAHRSQVIHGDLKSNNVILTTEPHGAIRAMITDFGLARRLATQQSAVPSGEVGGAMDYMAPELLKGEKPSVASDLYALGVMLYELASGRRPFGGEPWEDRLTRLPAPLKHPWNRTLQRCLDPDPTRRFASAADVAVALAPASPRRWFLAGTAAAVLAVSTFVVHELVTGPKESIHLAMLPFVSGPDTAALAENLSRDAAGQLGRLTGGTRAKLRVIPLSKAVGKHADTVEKTRTMLGATQVLHGTLEQAGGKVVLHAFLTDARSGVNAKDWKVEYAPGGVRSAPVALAGFVTSTLRLPPLATRAAVNAAAEQDYWAGLWYIRQNSTLDAALPLLERAVAADPDSPLTYAGLAEAQWFEYRLTNEPAWLERAAESVRQAGSLNPDVAPVHRVEGYLDYAAGSYEQAVAEFERAIELQPSNATAYIWLGKAYEDNNHLDRALTAFQKAVEVEPRYFRPYQDLGAFYLQRSNFSEGAKYHKKAVDLAPSEPNLRRNLAVAYMDLGQFAEAEHELRVSIGQRETLSAVHGLGITLMYQARDQEAIPYFLRASSLRSAETTPRYLPLMYLGIAYRRSHLLAEANEVYRRALEMAEAEMARNPRNGYVRAFLGYFAAALGDRRRAESEIAQALRLFPNDADTRWRAVLSYEALGLRDKTLEVLSTSTAEQLGDVNRWPDLADLHRNRRFLELLASKQVK